jgi:hypothetical protein
VDRRKASQPELGKPDLKTPALKEPDLKTSRGDDGTSSRDVDREGDRPEPAPTPPLIDHARAGRLRADARRPLSENLADGIALSHLLVRYARETPQR